MQSSLFQIKTRVVMKFPVSVTEKCFHRRECCIVKTYSASAIVDKTHYSEIISPVTFVLMF